MLLTVHHGDQSPDKPVRSPPPALPFALLLGAYSFLHVNRRKKKKKSRLLQQLHMIIGLTEAYRISMEHVQSCK